MIRTIALCLFLLLPPAVALARDGDFDLSLQGSGRLRVALPNGHAVDETARMAVLADGGILLAASDSPGIGVQADFNVLRLTADGSLDTGFGNAGVRTIAFDLGGDFADTVQALAVQGNGRILVVGSAAGDPAGSGSDCALARLTTGGALDTSFSGSGRKIIAFDLGPAGLRTDNCLDVAVQADGRIVIAGSAQTATGALTMVAARLNPDGSPDSGFGPGGKRVVAGGAGILASLATRVLVLADGRILLVGICAAAQTGPLSIDWCFARLHANGDLDTGFGTNGFATHGFDLGGDGEDLAYAAVAHDDGSFVVAGAARSAPGSDDIVVAAFQPNGSLDTTFGNQGRIVIAYDFGDDESDIATAIARDAQGRYVIAGALAVADGNRDMAVVRLLANGQPDAAPGSGFGVQGKLNVSLSVPPQEDSSERAYAVAIAPDGAVVVAGVATIPSSGIPAIGIARLRGDTVFDNGFD